jgi:hypothetical protein
MINCKKPIAAVVPELELEFELLELESFEVTTGLGWSIEDGDLQEFVQTKTNRKAKPIKKNVFFMG